MLKKNNMFHLHIINHVVRFRASEGGDLKPFLNAQEACTMKKTICLIASTVLILSASGCATSSCGNGLFGGGLFGGSAASTTQGGFFQNNPMRSFFQGSRGAPCDTCNPASGQVSNGSFSVNRGFSGNVAPLCQDGSCGGGSPVSAPANIQLNDPGVPYYDNGSGFAPGTTIQSPGNSVLPQGNIVPQGSGTSNLIQGSSNRVSYGTDNLPSIDALSNSLDADAWPPTP